MASQRKGEQKRGEERSKREQQAEKILDAAGELLLRWGYNKTTLDDIARYAGVPKGTIYFLSQMNRQNRTYHTLSFRPLMMSWLSGKE